jgi:hypothetical protein
MEAFVGEETEMLSLLLFPKSRQQHCRETTDARELT